ncbi:DUF2798 domain-containing protein [Hyphomicrobium sp. 1Nfss2.1]|uniref:DUF2798 domain-containing protein n=1 Tax=Hyphomicrobium sp. 1Nfss2.1 TaxID=3413936 RepID=UPI003C7BEA8F
MSIVQRSQRRRLPAQYVSIIMPLVLSLLMTFVVSAISTWKSLGFGPMFLSTWPVAWGLSWLVAFPTLLVVLPVVRRIVGLIVEPPLANR